MKWLVWLLENKRSTSMKTLASLPLSFERRLQLTRLLSFRLLWLLIGVCCGFLLGYLQQEPILTDEQDLVFRSLPCCHEKTDQQQQCQRAIQDEAWAGSYLKQNASFSERVALNQTLRSWLSSSEQWRASHLMQPLQLSPSELRVLQTTALNQVIVFGVVSKEELAIVPNFKCAAERLGWANVCFFALDVDSLWHLKQLGASCVLFYPLPEDNHEVYFEGHRFQLLAGMKHLLPSAVCLQTGLAMLVIDLDIVLQQHFQAALEALRDQKDLHSFGGNSGLLFRKRSSLRERLSSLHALTRAFSRLSDNVRRY
jgi:hypothetical protein